MLPVQRLLPAVFDTQQPARPFRPRPRAAQDASCALLGDRIDPLTVVTEQVRVGVELVLLGDDAAILRLAVGQARLRPTNGGNRQQSNSGDPSHPKTRKANTTPLFAASLLSGPTTSIPANQERDLVVLQGYKHRT
jgi:hypothetical protein